MYLPPMRHQIYLRSRPTPHHPPFGLFDDPHPGSYTWWAVGPTLSASSGRCPRPRGRHSAPGNALSRLGRRAIVQHSLTRCAISADLAPQSISAQNVPLPRTCPALPQLTPCSCATHNATLASFAQCPALPSTYPSDQFWASSAQVARARRRWFGYSRAPWRRQAARQVLGENPRRFR